MSKKPVKIVTIGGGSSYTPELMEGFIKRYDYKKIPPKVEYSLTELGQSFMPVMEYIKSWGEQHLIS